MFGEFKLLMVALVVILAIGIHDATRITNVLHKIEHLNTSQLLSNQSDMSTDLKEFLMGLNTAMSHNQKNTSRTKFMDPQEHEFSCFFCLNLMEDLIDKRRNRRKNDQYFSRYVFDMCVVLGIQTPDVCRKMIDLNLPVIFYIIDNNPRVGKDEFCLLILQEAQCHQHIIEIETDIELRKQMVTEIPSHRNTTNISKPRTKPTKSVRRKVPTQSPWKNEEDELIIIHITDLHVDFDYIHKGNAECEEPVCCHEMVEMPSTTSNQAGLWGDYRYCDTPYEAAKDAFKQIKKQHPKIDMIYFTGDIVDHRMWEKSIEKNTKSIKKTFELLKEIFGAEIPIYPVLGNHEPHPANLFSPPGMTLKSSSAWLYDLSAELWSEWLPTDTINTIKDGGYYTTLIRPGLRLVALNNNYCIIYNWWLIHDETPFVNQFKWLRKVLQNAEKNNESVHILAHIPNGSTELYDSCSQQFRKIVNKYHKTIKAQFNGHTETTNFNLFFSSKRSPSPISVAFNGGGLSTYSETNRNYVLYKVHPSSFQVNDMESWIYNLTEANMNPMEKPRWFKQFSLKEDFNLTDLSPTSLKSFARDLATGRSNLEDFRKFKVKASDRLIGSLCNSICFKEILCELVTFEVFQEKQCRKLEKLYENNSRWL